ncbi:hypothetical protein GOP47_0026669 [Adiantum capillus-veneris]|nr:hypothetical protein GOP47_0026669 [Adiantum capillus-veneris]
MKLLDGEQPLVQGEDLQSVEKEEEQGVFLRKAIEQWVEKEFMEWGLNYVLQHEIFETKIKETMWKDLKFKIFLVWDGNHHVEAWMSCVHEAWSHIPSCHVHVRSQFLVIGKNQEGELLLAMKS